MNEQNKSSHNNSISGAGNITGTTEKLVHHVSEPFMWFASLLLLITTLLIVADVFGRSIFNIPVPGANELVQLILVCITFSGIIYTTAKKAHVLVEILVTHFAKGVQRVLVSVMTFIGGASFAVLSWQLGLSANSSMVNGLHTSALGFPFAPFKFFAAVAAGVTGLFFLIQFAHSIGKQS